MEWPTRRNYPLPSPVGPSIKLMIMYKADSELLSLFARVRRRLARALNGASDLDVKQPNTCVFGEVLFCFLNGWCDLWHDWLKGGFCFNRSKISSCSIPGFYCWGCSFNVTQFVLVKNSQYQSEFRLKAILWTGPAQVDFNEISLKIT